VAFNMHLNRGLKNALLLGTLVLQQSCWVMGVCVDQAACDKYGDVHNGGSGGGCGNSDLLGTWQNASSEYFTLSSDDCEFTGYCAMRGTFEANSSRSSGTLTLRVTASNSTLDTDCPAPGTYACEFSISSTERLSLSCPDAYGDSPGTLQR
jgi:hypothetical protein